VQIYVRAMPLVSAGWIAYASPLFRRLEASLISLSAARRSSEKNHPAALRGKRGRGCSLAVTGGGHAP
jgi:hypothetical protein